MIFGFFNLGFGEIFAIFVVVLLLFGADKIPEFARSLGKGIRYVKDATDNVKRDIQSSVDEVKTDIDANVKEVKKNFEAVDNVKRRVNRQVNDLLEDVTSSVDNVAKDSMKEKPSKSVAEGLSKKTVDTPKSQNQIKTSKSS